MSDRTSAPYPRVVLALVLDAVLILAFAAIGRRSHEESGALVGVLATAWPFLAGMAAGWVLVLLATRSAPLGVRSGIPVWVGAVAGGMLLRAATGQGTAWPFVVVATLTLAVLLLGWRAVALLARSR